MRETLERFDPRELRMMRRGTLGGGRLFFGPGWRLEALILTPVVVAVVPFLWLWSIPGPRSTRLAWSHAEVWVSAGIADPP